MRRPNANPELPSFWFHELKVGHDPKDPAEATLVLAAAAAANGLRCDGEPMAGSEFGKPPSVRWISRQLFLSLDAVRRGVEHLVRVDAAHVQDGVVAHPEALTRRWSNYRQRIRVTTELRLLHLRPRPLLLASLIAGQIDRQGRLCLGVHFLAERTGLPVRTVERALASCRQAGAIQTWSVPLSGRRRQLFTALGRSRNGGRDGSQSGGSDAPSKSKQPLSTASGVVNRRSPWSQSGGHPGSETAVRWSQSGGRLPDCPPDLPPDSPPDAPASPAGETRAAPTAPNPKPTPDGRADAKRRIESWVVAFIKKGIERLTDAHVFDVAGLIDQLGPPPKVVRNRGALLADRRELAKRVIRWCPQVERLGRWLTRASRWFGVDNLAGYLRRACEKGDPGTVLESALKNRVGRTAETWSDFAPGVERSLEGARLADTQRIVTGLAAVLSSVDDAERNHLREELREHLARGNRVAARVALLRLVSADRSDVAIARAIGDACSLTTAKDLLAV